MSENAPVIGVLEVCWGIRRPSLLIGRRCSPHCCSKQHQASRVLDHVAACSSSNDLRVHGSHRIRIRRCPLTFLASVCPETARA